MSFCTRPQRGQGPRRVEGRAGGGARRAAPVEAAAIVHERASSRAHARCHARGPQGQPLDPKPAATAPDEPQREQSPDAVCAARRAPLRRQQVRMLPLRRCTTTRTIAWIARGVEVCRCCLVRGRRHAATAGGACAHLRACAPREGPLLCSARTHHAGPSRCSGPSALGLGDGYKQNGRLTAQRSQEPSPPSHVAGQMR